MGPDKKYTFSHSVNKVFKVATSEIMRSSMFLPFLFLATSVSGETGSGHLSHVSLLVTPGGKGNRESPVTCASDNVACDVVDDNGFNGIDSIGGVPSIEECRQLCYDVEECQFITYFGPDSFYVQETCFLLRSCEEVHSCNDCVTETRSCYKSSQGTIIYIYIYRTLFR